MPASPFTDSPFADLERPPLSARALHRAVVVPGGLWRRIDLRPETGSTNADAAAAASAGEPEGLVVIAERQTDGRGRRDRQWVSPPRAGLTLSVLLRPGLADPSRGWAAVPNRGYGWLPLLAGVALLDTVTRFAELDAALKWPNDLLVRVDGAHAKCAGILAEVVGTPIPAVVLGIGLNVTTRAAELSGTAAQPPPGARPAIGGLSATAGRSAVAGLPATSLQLAGAATTDRDPLLRALLRGFADHYLRWRAAGGDAAASGLLDAYRRGCATIGREVRVLLPDGALAGAATTVDADGQLVIRTADGERRLAAGDVLHVR
jgi:BirA family biotin operon repressor/biotin-[acetyl-CoA-carboxylase] ligase